MEKEGINRNVKSIIRDISQEAIKFPDIFQFSRLAENGSRPGSEAVLEATSSTISAATYFLWHQYDNQWRRQSWLEKIRILRILKNSRIVTNFKRFNKFYFFNTFEFWHVKVLHFLLQSANWNFSDLLIIIQELIHVGYQQSK